MVLRPCVQCAKEISSDANPCPSCGKKDPHKAKPSGTGTFLLVLLGFPALIALCNSGQLASSRKTALAEATPAVEPAKAAAPAPPVADDPPVVVDTKEKINPYAVTLIEGAGWDKTRQAWGQSWITRINAALPKMAEKVARAADCDHVEVVGLSSDRSTPKETAVFFADCRNDKRFYVTEDELNSEAQALSNSAKTAAVSNSEAVLACEDSVKSQLNFPLSFDRDWSGSRVYRAPSGNIAVEFTFTAKNALGAELPQRAHCVVDDRGMHPAKITNG